MMRKFVLIAFLFICFNPIKKVFATESALTLKDALKMGLENNSKIAQSNTDYKKANRRHSKKVFFPNLNASVSGGVGYNSQRLRYTASSTEAAIHLPINFFDKYFLYQKNSAILDVKRCESTLNAINKTVEIASAYFKMVLEQKILTIRRRAMEVSKENKDLIELAYKIGKEPKSRYTHALIQYNNDLVTFYQQEDALAKAKLELCDLIGKSSKENFIVDGETVLNAKNDDHFDKISIDSSTSISLDRYELNLANLNLSSLWYKILPSFSIKIGYRLDNELITWDKRFSYGATVTFNIFEILNLNDEIACGSIDLDRLSEAARANKIKLQANLDAYILLYKQQKAHLTLIQKNLELSMQNFQAMQEQYELGKISAIEYNDSKRNAEVCEVSLLNVLYQIKIYELKIISTTCRTIEEFLSFLSDDV